MFKGLKTKLAEETKKIQTAVVNQVNESLASNSSRRQDSESSVTERNVDNKFSPPVAAKSTTVESEGPALIDISLESPHGNAQHSSSISQNMSSSSLMQESDDIEFHHGRQRRDSAGSLGSLDSSANIFPKFTSNVSHHLSPVHSDLESTTDMESTVGSSYLTGASKEQISNVLHKLQGRASSYREKYRELGKTYNEVLRENEKCKAVLTTTQDKALRRIEQLREEKQLLNQSKRELENNLRSKLSEQDGIISALREQVSFAKEGKAIDEEAIAEVKPLGCEATELIAEKEKVRRFEELLSRCKESIKTNKEKIYTLTCENEQLKEKLNSVESDQGNAGISDLAADRVAAHWKEKLESAEKEWAEKLRDADERSVMAVAEAKQDMHNELEKRELEIGQLRHKVKSLENNVSKEMEQYREEVETSQETINALEAEKKELIEQLSKTKQEAVRLVKEEELKKREALQVEFKEKVAANDVSWEEKMACLAEKHKETMRVQEEQLRMQLREQEEQMQLAVEEREMQKVAAVTEQDRRNDQLHCQMEQLATEKLQLESSLEKQKEEYESRFYEMTLSIEANSKRHKEEQSSLRRQFEEDLERAQQFANSGEEGLRTELLEAQKLSAQGSSINYVTPVVKLVDNLLEEKSAAESSLEALKFQLDKAKEEILRISEETASVQNEKEKRFETDINELNQELAVLRDLLDLEGTEKRTLEQNVTNLERTLSDREERISEMRDHLSIT